MGLDSEQGQSVLGSNLPGGCRRPEPFGVSACLPSASSLIGIKFISQVVLTGPQHWVGSQSGSTLNHA